MEDNQIDFKSDINKYSKIFVKSIKINNTEINLSLIKYNDKKLTEIYQKWQTCFEILGKANMFKNKNIIKILYCLLTDSCIISLINNQKMDLDLYDLALQRFLRLEVIDKNNRIIKIRIFTVCDSMIIIDCKDMSKYKIYELHNLQLIKKYYDINKINFDAIITDLFIEPIFVGNINNLQNDFKILSLKNIKIFKEILLTNLIKYTSHCIQIEVKLQKEYNKFYKECTNKTKLTHHI